MGKRKSHIDSDPNVDRTDSSDHLGNPSSEFSSASLPGPNVDEYDVWLIRKPIRVPVSDLSSIKFPHKAKNRTRTAMPSRPDALPLNCQFNRLAERHVYIPTAGIRNQKDAMQLKAAYAVKGVVLVNEKLNLFDGGAVPKSDEIIIKQEGDSSVPLENETAEMNLTIGSIRKKPRLPAGDNKQRLKPFGIIPKEDRKDQKLPSLINS